MIAKRVTAGILLFLVTLFCTFFLKNLIVEFKQESPSIAIEEPVAGYIRSVSNLARSGNSFSNSSQEKCIVDNRESPPNFSDLEYELLSNKVTFLKAKDWEQLLNLSHEFQQKSVERSKLETQSFSTAMTGCYGSNDFVAEADSILIPFRSTKPCSASLIGPKTIILAAHCLERNFESLIFRFGVRNQVRISATCVRNESANVQKLVNDLALCKLEESPNKETERVKMFQTLKLDASIGDSESLGLAGYGLNRLGLDSVLLSGEARHIKDSKICRTYANRSLSSVEDFNRICTIAAPSTSEEINSNFIKPFLLCPGRINGVTLANGDSGGPLFQLYGNNKKSIVGIASQRCDHRESCEEFHNTLSIFANLGEGPMEKFVKKWSKTCGEICGVGWPDSESGPHKKCPKI